MQIKSIGMWLDNRLGWLEPWTGHHLRWWMALYQPPVPYDANIYYNLIWATIYLSCTWSIKMNRTVVRIDCNFLSFSSTKVHFWHEDSILSALPLQLQKCNLSDQPLYMWRGVNSSVGLKPSKSHLSSQTLQLQVAHTSPYASLTRLPCVLYTAWLKLSWEIFNKEGAPKAATSLSLTMSETSRSLFLTVKDTICYWYWRRSHMLLICSFMFKAKALITG